MDGGRSTVLTFVSPGDSVAALDRSQRTRGARNGRQDGRVEGGYERFIAGDLEGAVDLWTDDFLWDGAGSGLPGSGQYEGKQAAIDVLQQAVGAWDKFELSADEFVEQGDTVVTLGRTDVTKGDRSRRAVRRVAIPRLLHHQQPGHRGR